MWSIALENGKPVNFFEQSIKSLREDTEVPPETFGIISLVSNKNKGQLQELVDLVGPKNPCGFKVMNPFLDRCKQFDV
jgi:hypothetical protein